MGLIIPTDLLVIGLLRGALYALMAMGLALVLGVMKMSNFAHGELYMFGAYGAYFAYTILNASPLVAILAGALSGLVAGAVIDRLLLAPLRQTSRQEWLMNSFLLTMGLSLVIQNAAIVIWKPEIKGIHQYWQGTVQVSSKLSVGLDRLVAFGLSLLIIGSIWLVLNRTKVGRAMRAVAQDATGAALIGIDLNKMYILAFSLSAMLAGAAGGILLPIVPAAPTMGAGPLYKAYIVMTLAGYESFVGAIIGGFLIGVLETASYHAFGSGWPDVVSLCMVILILVVKPSGLFGRVERG